MRDKTTMEFYDRIKNIPPVNQGAREEAKRRWNEIAHPLHSLGKLEDYVVFLAGITGEFKVEKPKKALVVRRQRGGGGGRDPDRPGSHGHCSGKFLKRAGHSRNSLP